MPIYEYACTNCGERTEAKQSFTDPPLEECPHCGGLLRKLFSPVGIVFKGTGFYATDARKGSSKSSDAKSGTKDGSQDGATKPETKSETRSETKSSGDQASSGSASKSSGD
jgi:putative FmdB family regulatory protein